ncbi:photosystem II reaction center protein PsbN [Synechococcales cyanobacterium C]|uniref:Protein PsbN n=1 Tax=Petrachloros mirabilis ULC683 TaxID=2781853 RepID=A0A8K1ZWA4_9CYAN|nr:photosystem II reaction center protein PsbN [Petrachloros mirabilis]NCJ06063.1 photosystem II reaction center protein PsbN [Petrachloros mirabilis ULC683]
MEQLDPATVLSITIAVVFVAITGVSIYTAFGPPAKDLDDPFEDHED